MSVLEITALGMIAGVVGTGAGGLLAFAYPNPPRRFMGLVMGFAGGVMLAIVFLELIEEALAIGSLSATIAGLLLGIISFLILDQSIPHHHVFTVENEEKARFLKKGMLIFLGIALHNFPEGFAIGAGFISSSELGLTLALLIGLHNIPEGMSVAIPLKYGGLGNIKTISAALLAGLPMGLGALLGALISNISATVLTLSLGFAAGAMLYIVCDELIPEAYESAGPHFAISGITIGVVMGVILIVLI